jgi:hypothetical protein
MGKNKQKKQFDPNRNVSQTTQVAREKGYAIPADAFAKNPEFDPSKEIEGWNLLLPYAEFTQPQRLRLLDAFKHCNTPVNVEIVRASHIVQSNFTALANLIEVVQERFVVDPLGWYEFLNGTDGVTEDEALARTSGLVIAYGMLLGKHSSSSN